VPLLEVWAAMRRALPLVFALGLVAASAAGVALGVVAVVAAERMRGLLGEVEWGDEDE
jgi:hypothetical protein